MTKQLTHPVTILRTCNCESSHRWNYIYSLSQK